METMDNRLYRSRLTEKPTKAAEKFMSSLEDDYEILIEDIVGTEAHDIMLCERGIIPKSDLKKILHALENLRNKFETGTLKLTGEYEDVHEFIEDKVIQAIGIDSGGRLHTARSRKTYITVSKNTG